MDVLQLLKSELRERRSELSGLGSPEPNDATRRSIRSALSVHLAWESEFLLPELSHVAPQGEAILDRYQQSLKRLRELAGKKSQNDSDVLDAFSTHTDIVEEKVLPFMRQKIPTAEREELYHVFADAKQEMMATSGSSYVM